MLNNKTILALMSVIGFSAIAFANTNETKPARIIHLPQAYQAEYQIKSSKYKVSAKANRVFSVDKLNASISQKASVMLASIEQQSVFSFENNSCLVKSHHYDYKHTVLGKRKRYSLNFDYNKQAFYEVKDEQSNSFPIEEVFYDELSYQEALRCELKNAEKLNIGDNFSYSVRTKGRSKPYQFEVVAFEKLKTRLGEIQSVKLERIRSSQKEQEQSHIWFSQAHDFLLVKFTQHDKDDSYSLDILKLNP